MPLIRYSLSPERKIERLTSISDIGTGISPASLSITSLTSAIPSAGRLGVPAKITSAICPPRSARGPCSPSAQLIASTRFDFPEPLGPTITLTPGMNSRTVLSAKDLNPRIWICRKNMRRDANSGLVLDRGGERHFFFTTRSGTPSPGAAVPPARRPDPPARAADPLDTTRRCPPPPRRDPRTRPRDPRPGGSGPSRRVRARPPGAHRMPGRTPPARVRRSLTRTQRMRTMVPDAVSDHLDARLTEDAAADPLRQRDGAPRRRRAERLRRPGGEPVRPRRRAGDPRGERAGRAGHVGRFLRRLLPGLAPGVDAPLRRARAGSGRSTA